jgi:hypothetical protein
LGLINGNWIIIGSSPWQPHEWKMPTFRRTDSISGVTFAVTYADDDPSQALNERRVTPKIATGFPDDDLFGSGAVEIRLTKLMS